MSTPTPALDPKRTALLGKVFPRRAQVIDTAALRTLLQET
jgi:hypothetical protein